MKKLFTITTVFILLFATTLTISAETLASPKEEVVYGLLGLDGHVTSVIVVNIFEGGSITDYGDYTELTNLTSSEKITQSGDLITITTTSDQLYLQGTLKQNALPWTFDITYTLDGQVISGSALGGKSGALKIALSVKKNPDVNDTFFNNYALQISLALDNKLCSNIVTQNATVAEAGSKKQLSYTILPGKEMDIEITSTVHDFEMSPISINGIKLTLGISVNTDEFSAQIAELTDAIGLLDDGATDLLAGLNKLSVGFQKYVEGMNAFNTGLQQLSDGASSLSLGVTGLNNGLAQLVQQNETLIAGALAIQQATFDSVNASLSQMNLGLPELTPTNYSAILSGIPDLALVKVQLDGSVQFTQGLIAYCNGVEQLSQGADGLALGMVDFSNNSSILAVSSNDLYTASLELNDAVKQLRSGLAAYKEGTQQLADETKDLSQQIDDKINEMLNQISGNGDPVISFVSEKNTQIKAVQFALKTSAITLPVVEVPAEPAPVKLNFWQKLANLFSFITTKLGL